MNTTGNCLSGGTMHGAGIPVPLEPRPIRERPKRRGLDWPAPTGPDPDAVARVKAAKPKPKPRRKPGPKPGSLAPRPRADVDTDGLAEAYLSGVGLKELARQHRTHHMTIRKRLVDLGVQIRPSGGSGQTFDVQRARALREKGLSYAAIARTLGFSERAVRNHIGGRS